MGDTKTISFKIEDDTCQTCFETGRSGAGTLKDTLLNFPVVHIKGMDMDDDEPWVLVAFDDTEMCVRFRMDLDSARMLGAALTAVAGLQGTIQSMEEPEAIVRR